MDSDIFRPTPLEVMHAIWDRSDGDMVFLPTIKNDIWTEGDGWVPRLIDGNFPPEEGVDYYFTPLKYAGARKRGLVGKPGVIFADLDGEHRQDYGDMPPSVVIATSPGHYHAYWFLDRPADPGKWEQHAQGWTQEIGADPAGWDITQVLRVPGTINNKNDDKVTIVNFRPDRVYPLYQFPKAAMRPDLERRSRPTRSPEMRGTLLEAGFETGDIPLAARYWLTVTAAELQALGKIDRSSIMWGIEKALISEGYTIEETYQLMYFTAINKWKDDPAKLWEEIIKAAS